MTCRQCGRPAQHVVTDLASQPAYCCHCFNHSWPHQQLLPGQECAMERVEVVTEPRWVWRWKDTEVRPGAAED